MEKRKFDEFLRLNELSYRVRKIYESEKEGGYTVEVYHGNHLIADGNEHYVKIGQEYKLDYEWLYDYICDLPGSREWNAYVGNGKEVKRIDNTLEASTLLKDIKELGIPNILFYMDGCRINIQPDEIEKTDLDIIFKSNGKQAATISPWARIIPTNRLGNVIGGIFKAYEVMEGTFNHTNMFIVWPERN